MKNRKINSTLAIVFTILSINISAQDYHFSQFDALVPSYQPALTGMFDDYKYRAASQYRNQWRPLATKPFSTFGMSFDMPVNNRWGLGGYLVNYDGARVFNAFSFIVSGAYKVTDPNQKKHLLTTGLQAGIVYKNINNSDLLFENQYSNGEFNPSLPSNENFQRLSKLVPEFNFGVYYEWIDELNDYHPYVGVSVFHITSPKESLLSTEADSRLPRRFMFNGGCKLDITKELEIDIKGMYQYQGKAREILFGSSGAYLIGESKTKVNLGLFYRVQDAAFIMTGISYEELTFNLSYDITTSGLSSYNNNQGALEFTLIYQPQK